MLILIITMFYYKIVVFFIAISTSFDLFPENGKYTYRLQSYVTLVPDLHSQENPQWNMNGVLEVDRIDPQKLVLRVRCPFTF